MRDQGSLVLRGIFAQGSLSFGQTALVDRHGHNTGVQCALSRVANALTNAAYLEEVWHSGNCQSFSRLSIYEWKNAHGWRLLLPIPPASR